MKNNERKLCVKYQHFSIPNRAICSKETNPEKKRKKKVLFTNLAGIEIEKKDRENFLYKDKLEEK